MRKEKRKQSKDEENDSSSRKRRKTDLSKPVSFVSTGKVEICRAESIIIKIIHWSSNNIIVYHVVVFVFMFTAILTQRILHKKIIVRWDFMLSCFC